MSVGWQAGCGPRRAGSLEGAVRGPTAPGAIRSPLAILISRKRGRVVDCTGLENRQRATVREFESHRFRQNADPSDPWLRIPRGATVPERPLPQWRGRRNRPGLRPNLKQFPDHSRPAIRAVPGPHSVCPDDCTRGCAAAPATWAIGSYHSENPVLHLNPGRPARRFALRGGQACRGRRVAGKGASFGMCRRLPPAPEYALR